MPNLCSTNLESIATTNANGAVANGDAKHNNMFDKFSAHSPEIALKADSLSKTYDGRHYAAKDVTFSVKSGECFGLLGSNGAGKSTVIQIFPHSSSVIGHAGSALDFSNFFPVLFAGIFNAIG